MLPRAASRSRIDASRARSTERAHTIGQTQAEGGRVDGQGLTCVALSGGETLCRQPARSVAEPAVMFSAFAVARGDRGIPMAKNSRPDFGRLRRCRQYETPARREG